MERSNSSSSDLEHLSWALEREENFFGLLASYLSVGAPLGLTIGAFRLWLVFSTKTTVN